MAISKVNRIIGVIVVCILVLLAVSIIFDLTINKRVNVIGSVLFANGTLADDVKVTLWHNGNMVQMHGNPQNVRIINRYNQTNSWFEFDSLPDDDYYMTAIKDGYAGWSYYDKGNPLALPLGLFAGPNVTGFCVNHSLGKTVQVYDNVSRSEIGAAVSIASKNASVRQIVNGTDYEIIVIYRQKDVLGYDTIYQAVFYENPVLVSNETGWSRYDKKFGCLNVFVNTGLNAVVKIEQTNS